MQDNKQAKQQEIIALLMRLRLGRQRSEPFTAKGRTCCMQHRCKGGRGRLGGHRMWVVMHYIVNY